ncbi:MAG: TIGR01777 family oxidoreductase [Rhodoglobus sp.]
MVRTQTSGMRVLVAGASGFIGRALTRQLESDGYRVSRLVRSQPRSNEEYLWTPSQLTLDQRAIDSTDAVINLAGATTGRIPWTARYKNEILNSRVSGTRCIVEAIDRSSSPPAVFLSGSAVGYFGDQPGVRLTETSAKGMGFLSDVVEAWEHAARLTPTTTRVTMFRTGVVVGNGGAFTPLIPLTKLGLATRFGSGEQNWPWISLRDEVAAICHLLTSKLDGVVNLVGPTPATSAEITNGLAEALNRWHPWSVPRSMINFLGDAGKDLLLSSQNVVPERLIADGFTFTHDTAQSAIHELASSL